MSECRRRSQRPTVWLSYPSFPSAPSCHRAKRQRTQRSSYARQMFGWVLLRQPPRWLALRTLRARRQQSSSGASSSAFPLVLIPFRPQRIPREDQIEHVDVAVLLHVGFQFPPVPASPTYKARRVGNRADPHRNPSPTPLPSLYTIVTAMSSKNSRSETYIPSFPSPSDLPMRSSLLMVKCAGTRTITFLPPQEPLKWN